MLATVMMTIDVEDVNDLAAIERGVTAAQREFASRAMHEIVRLVETTAENEDPGRLRRKGTETRTLWMTCGWARFDRQRYVDTLEGRSYVLFDERVGLARYQRVTEGARAMLSDLSAVAPSYDKTRLEVEILWGDSPATTAIWAYTQAEGRALGARQEALRRAIFEDGDLPGTEIPPKDFVGVQADETRLCRWQRKGERFQAHVGMAYDGKDSSRSGKRRRLTHKVAVASVQGAAAFGKDLFAAAQKEHNIVEARSVLYSSDGEEALETIRQVHFHRAEHQLDHHHVVSKAYEAYGWDQKESARAALGYVFGEKRGTFEATVRADMRRFPQRRAKLGEYLGYILPRWNWIFAAQRLQRAHPEGGVPGHISGTGGEERLVDLLVGHRMKHRGMGWTDDGAANMMRVRLRILGLQTF